MIIDYCTSAANVTDPCLMVAHGVPLYYIPYAFDKIIGPEIWWEDVITHQVSEKTLDHWLKNQSLKLQLIRSIFQYPNFSDNGRRTHQKILESHNLDRSRILNSHSHRTEVCSTLFLVLNVFSTCSTYWLRIHDYKEKAKRTAKSRNSSF